jgi:hypothetical protein
MQEDVATFSNHDEGEYAGEGLKEHVRFVNQTGLPRE